MTISKYKLIFIVHNLLFRIEIDKIWILSTSKLLTKSDFHAKFKGRQKKYTSIAIITCSSKAWNIKQQNVVTNIFKKYRLGNLANLWIILINNVITIYNSNLTYSE